MLLKMGKSLIDPSFANARFSGYAWCENIEAEYTFPYY
jgi:hypothetical protein